LTGQIVMTECYPFAAGGFSDVYRGEWVNPDTSTAIRVAIKLFRRIHTNPADLTRITKRLRRETRVWLCLSHQNVVPFLGLCDGLGPSFAMISPLYNNGDVQQYFEKNPRADRPPIVIGIARGLCYLHAQHVIHGDLKPNNILVDDDGTALVADFGQSRLIDHRGFTTTTMAGSSRQMAPELFSNDEGDASRLTRYADVYAFSMVALEIMTDKKPFFSTSKEMIVVLRVSQGERPLRSSYPETMFTDHMWALLVDCWAQDLLDRPDMETVVQRLEVM